MPSINQTQTQGARPSQQFVEIKKIEDGVLHIKGGGLRKILMVSGINFDLKSEAEQNVILNSFQNFLNTLDFPAQFFIHSRKVNVKNYLGYMTGRKEQETNELLKIQIDEYIKFVQSFVEENDIISKSFFVVVPFEGGRESVEQAAKGLLNIFKKTEKKKEVSMQESIQQLNQRVDSIISGLGQLGLRVVALEDDELTELFYNLYNPQLVEKKELEIMKKH